MKKKVPITPHTIFIYSWGNFLRIVRGEHTIPDAKTKPRRYESLKDALENEHRSKIVAALNLFPKDTLIDRRLKAVSAPVPIKKYQTLAAAIRSHQFLYAQAGYDSNHKEIAYIYHRSTGNQTGLTMARSGPVNAVRQLLKKYKKPRLRELNYKDRKPRIAQQEKRA